MKGVQKYALLLHQGVKQNVGGNFMVLFFKPSDVCTPITPVFFFGETCDSWHVLSSNYSCFLHRALPSDQKDAPLQVYSDDGTIFVDFDSGNQIARESLRNLNFFITIAFLESI